MFVISSTCCSCTIIIIHQFYKQLLHKKYTISSTPPPPPPPRKMLRTCTLDKPTFSGQHMSLCIALSLRQQSGNLGILVRLLVERILVLTLETFIFFLRKSLTYTLNLTACYCTLCSSLDLCK